LNALVFSSCNLPVISNDLFGKDFKNIQFLLFHSSKIELIEPEAFSELANLKYIYINSNPLKSLKSQIFKKNSKLEIVRILSSQITMINPNLFDGLTNLNFVMFDGNECVSKGFGCLTCSISQSELKTGLATCYSNCKNDLQCFTVKEQITESTKSLTTEITSSTSLIDQKLDKLDAKCETNFKNQKAEIEKTFQKSIQIEGKVQENLIQSKNTFQKLEIFISKESNFLENLKLLVEKNLESQNSLIENTTTSLMKSVDLTVSGIKTFFQEILVNQILKFEELSESMKKSNQETVESLNQANNETVENLETKIDLAIENIKNLNEKTVIGVEKKVEESNSKTRQYLDESNQATVRSLKEIVLNKTDSKLSQHLQKTEEKVEKAIELVNAKLSETKMALELEKANYIIEKKNMQEEIRDLKEKLATQSQDMKAMEEKFNNKMMDFVKAQLKEFEEKLKAESKP
jgi:hypothetical protein